MTRTVYYEQPLSERVRKLLRLEFLFDQTGRLLKGTDEARTRAAVGRLIELVDALGPGEIKAELLAELERNREQLQRFSGSEQVDQSRLQTTLDRLQRLTDALRAQAGHPAHRLTDDPLFAAVMKRSRIPGGTCGFDLPAFQHWLLRPGSERRATLDAWLKPLEPFREASETLLELLRETGARERCEAPSGSFEQTLDPSRPCQLLRIGLAENSSVYPEVSASHHRLTVRFLERPGTTGRAERTADTVPFELWRCYH